MSKVFVVDTRYNPLDPIHPGYARTLLSSGKAAVFRRHPFTLILKHEVQEPVTQLLRLKLDPGSKTTGIAIVNDASGEVVWAAELQHRGQAIAMRCKADVGYAVPVGNEPHATDNRVSTTVRNPTGGSHHLRSVDSPTS